MSSCGFILAFYIYALAAKTQRGSRHLELSAVQLLPYLLLMARWWGSDYWFPYAQWEQQRLRSACVPPSVHEHCVGRRREESSAPLRPSSTNSVQARGCKSKSTTLHTFKKGGGGGAYLELSRGDWVVFYQAVCNENYDFHLTVTSKETKKHRTNFRKKNDRTASR